MSDRRPELRLLANALKSLSWVDIQQLAIQLNIPLEVLTNLESHSIELRPSRAMNEWLSRDSEASWDKVVSGLRDISKNTLAKDIEDEYCPPAKRLRTESPLAPDGLRRPTPQLLPPPQIAKIASPVHTAPSTGTEDSPGRTYTRAIKLDCQFVNLVANTKTCCQEKEESDINFLRTLKNVLTTLQSIGTCTS